MSKFKEFWKNDINKEADNTSARNEYFEENAEKAEDEKNITVSYTSSSGKKLTRQFNSRAAYHQFMSTVGDEISDVKVEEK